MYSSHTIAAANIAKPALLAAMREALAHIEHAIAAYEAGDEQGVGRLGPEYGPLAGGPSHDGPIALAEACAALSRAAIGQSYSLRSTAPADDDFTAARRLIARLDGAIVGADDSGEKQRRKLAGRELEMARHHLDHWLDHDSEHDLPAVKAQVRRGLTLVHSLTDPDRAEEHAQQTVDDIIAEHSFGTAAFDAAGLDIDTAA